MLLNGSISELKAEARRRLEFDMGKYPSEDKFSPYDDPDEAADLEESMRQMEYGIFESIKQTEAYLWGLAIVGIYHLWERESRSIILLKTNINRDKLLKLDFKGLCKYITTTGYKISLSSNFRRLEIVSLIANAIKHGDGRARRQLLLIKPDLVDPIWGADVLRLGQAEFDDAVETIGEIWSEYESAFLANNSS